MSKQDLSNRGNWQTISGTNALKVEEYFCNVLQSGLNNIYPDQFLVERHPKDFDDIYSTYPLPFDTLNEIYNVNMIKDNGKPYKWGIIMDFAVRNLHNGKTIYGEIKRQDGWIETTDMSSGRGNAHERCCKYFTPGLLNALKMKSHISAPILPFWIIFTAAYVLINGECTLKIKIQTRAGNRKNHII